MKLTAQVQLNMRTKELQQAGLDFAREYAKELGNLTQEKAQENVAPGRGPGPHPHVTEHDDTGALRDSIQVRTFQQGFMVLSRVETDLDYGSYLELGWHTSSGRFVRYPWMMPAVELARREANRIARMTWNVYFSPSKFPMRVKMETGTFATVPPR